MNLSKITYEKPSAARVRIFFFNKVSPWSLTSQPVHLLEHRTHWIRCARGWIMFWDSFYRVFACLLLSFYIFLS